MKIDLKDDIRSICQEIHTLRECRHPNIVQFYGSYLRNNKLWICMEYCGGQSMQDIYLYTRKALEEDCIAFVSRETLQGLNFMHERGRIHRDIKGANILLTDDGRVKVADFGVAAQLNNTVGKRTTLIGTPYWMAPEVASIESRGAGYDGKCDVWGVGITAIEYAELQPPMFDLDPRKALQILGTRNYRPPTLQDRNKWSQRFHSFVKCCLVKHERRRPDAATMLTHTFVTNPNLSTQMTQRLLNFKRQLELRSKQPQPVVTAVPMPAPVPQPILAYNQPVYPNPVIKPVLTTQNGLDSHSASSIAYGNEVVHSPPPLISTAIPPAAPARVQQPVPQFVSIRHVLPTNESRLLSNAQLQDSPTISEYPAVPAASSTSSSEVTSVDGQPENVIHADPTMAISADGTVGQTRYVSNLMEFSRDSPPALPPKSISVRPYSAESDASIDGTREVELSAVTVLNPAANHRPSRPAPPPPPLILRADFTHPVDAEASAKVAGGEGLSCVGESALFTGPLLHGSSDDLLREVMDAFEKRRSCIELPENQSINGSRIAELSRLKRPTELLREKPLPACANSQQSAVANSIQQMSRSQDTPGQLPVQQPPVRTRSKRRAPPPPVQEGMALEESIPSASDSCIYQTVETPTDLRLPSRFENGVRQELGSDGDRDEQSPSLVIRHDRSYGPANDVGQLSLASEAPPRPPPPKVDYNQEEESRASRQYSLDSGIGLPPLPKVLTTRPHNNDIHATKPDSPLSPLTSPATDSVSSEVPNLADEPDPYWPTSS
ncbi:uncharacterized protein DEA37_0014451 [Paragonimus westermani]|uniref:Protein kinase domain-containing protein n=1 Tax=Paragonimus westermani TaxID=34504 RepID=A0A5J4NFG6_9TREM|nr:uncharacterized protein DEA37_0014451 [Paragonimus westermani]